MRGTNHVTLYFIGWRRGRRAIRIAARQWKSPHRVWRLLRFELIAWTVRLFCWRIVHVAIEQDGYVATIDSEGLHVWTLDHWRPHQNVVAVVSVPSGQFDVAGMADPGVRYRPWSVLLRRLTGLPIGLQDCVQIALESVCLAGGYERPRGVTTPKELLEWTRTLPGTNGPTLSPAPTNSDSPRLSS